MSIEKREFVGKDLNNVEFKMYVRKPTMIEIQNAEFKFKIAKSQAIRAGAMTLDEAIKIVKERNIWTDEQENTLSELFKQVDEKVTKLKPELPLEEGKKLCEEIDNIRTKIQLSQMPRIDVLSNTADSYAGEIRTQYFVSQCTYYQDPNEKVYKSFEDVLNKGNEPYTGSATENVIYLMNNITDFRERYPEFTYKKEHNLL